MTVLVVMGVSGAGKSTVAALLAGRLGWGFAEGDDLHPAANVQKMHDGHPLTDKDRQPWLARIAGWIDERIAAGESAVISCSALKRSYRDVLRRDCVVFVHLTGTREQLGRRLRVRHGHFMPAELLDSQLADLESPGPDEHAITVQIAESPTDEVDEVIAALALEPQAR